MENVDERALGLDHYKSLGLLGNPFRLGQWGEWSSMTSEVTREANRLLTTIVTAHRSGDSRPIWVHEPEGIDDAFFMEAISQVEFAFANEAQLRTLHAYVPLPAMRMGAVRSILGVLAERLVFGQFEETLERYVENVLTEAHTDLASYQVLGPDRLAEFGRQFKEDPKAALETVFGAAVIERKDEYAEVMDARTIDAENLGDENAEAELDGSIGVAPGIQRLDDEDAEEEAEAVEDEAADPSHMVLDYLIEYTKVHLSPVLARVLRAYNERGQVAAAAEFKVTKAPRKTLMALVRLARMQFDDIVVLLAEFDYWKDIPEGLRHKLVGALSELRWSLGDQGRLVFLAQPGQAAELEETFGSSNQLVWDFGAIRTPDRLAGAPDTELVDAWLEAATLPGAEPMTVSGTGLAALAESAGESFEQFIRMAHAAVEDAAARGASELDDEAVAAGRSVAATDADE